MRVAIGLRLESNENWEQAATYVTEAERLGVDFVWSHESWGLDAATPLAFMAARTSRIRLGSGIMQAGTRTPALLAMTALSLASMSDNRFVMGLGRERPPGDRGLARHPVRSAAHAHARDGRDRAARGARRAGGLQGPGLRAAAARRRGQGVAVVGQPARGADLPGDAVTAQPGDDRRDRRRLARHLVHARARARVLRPHRGGGQAGRPLAGHARPAGRRRTWRSATTSSACSPRASPAWRSRSAPWARASTTSTTTPSSAPATPTPRIEVQRLWLDGKRDEAAARVPDELAMKVNLLGTEAMVRERVIEAIGGRGSRRCASILLEATLTRGLDTSRGCWICYAPGDRRRWGASGGAALLLILNVRDRVDLQDGRRAGSP